MLICGTGCLASRESDLHRVQPAAVSLNRAAPLDKMLHHPPGLLFRVQLPNRHAVSAPRRPAVTRRMLKRPRVLSGVRRATQSPSDGCKPACASDVRSVESRSRC